jgi:hypothetical protein
MPGEVITEDAIEWRPVPRGLLAMPDLEVPVAAHDLSAGDPLTPGSVTDQSIVPAGWWSIPLNLPASAYVGSRVRLVLLSSYNSESATGAGGISDTWVEGVVVALGAADAFSVAEAGLVAVPPAAAQAVAVAAAEERLMVLYGP